MSEEGLTDLISPPDSGEKKKTKRQASKKTGATAKRGKAAGKPKAGRKNVSTSDEPPRWERPLMRVLEEGALIGLAAVSIYLLLALFSFDPRDPGFSHVGDVQTVSNSAGKTGAWFADVLLTLFGYLAYVFPCLILYRAWLVFRQLGKEEWSWGLFVLRLCGFFITILAGTGLASLHFFSAAYLPSGAGGIVGTEMMELSVDLFNITGATLLLLSGFLFGLTVFTDLSWLKLMDNTGRYTILAIDGSYRYVVSQIDRYRDRKQVKKQKEERKAVIEAVQEKVKERKPVKIAPPPKPVQKSVRVEKEKQTSLFKMEVTGELPQIVLLDEAKEEDKRGYSEEALEGMSRLLEIKLLDFGIQAEVTAVLPGPVVTSFEIQPAAGIKVSRISNLAKDLARSLAVISVRVVEVIPGKTVVGIEIPNENREMIRFSEIVSSQTFDNSASALTLALGKDISGQPIVADLAKMPHLLVAGTTGSGKSVGLNAMLLSMLFKSKPSELRMIMIDPKMLELSVYDDIPHLLSPVVTDMKEAANALKWCVAEMERRYRLMAAMGVRNVGGFNKKVQEGIKNKEPIKDPLFKPEGLDENEEAPELEPLPYIVVVIDEFADMMMIVGKKVEELIARIAQKARAAGIHLILATQRPSVDVITGLIKANVPSRIGFQVSSKVDSRTILDQGGAEQLLGHGDMLYLPPGTGLPIRVHGAFVSDEEVHRVCDDWRARGEPAYLDEVLEGTHEAAASIGASADATMGGGGGSSDDEADPLYDEAVAFVTQTRKASISSVQRKLKIGYNRAARMIEAMEAAGVVSEMQSNGSREVIAPPPVEV